MYRRVGLRKMRTIERPFTFAMPIAMNIHRLRRPLSALVLGLAALLGPAAALANTVELAGVTLDERVTVAGKPLQLNGAGIRYKAVFKVYTAGLYLEKKAGTPEQVWDQTGPKRMTITMLRDIDSAELGKLFSRGMEDNMEKGSFARLIPGVMRMSQVFSNHKTLKTGESFIIEPVGGAATGALEGLAQLLFGTARVHGQDLQARGQHLAQQGVVGQLAQHVGGGHALPRDRDDFVDEAIRRDAGPAERDGPLDDEGQGGDGTQDQRPDRPACGLYDGQQISLRADESNRRLWPSLWRPLRHKPLPYRARFPSLRSPTKTVDNFVGNPHPLPRKVAPRRACNRLMKNCAMKNIYKSTTCTCSRVLRPIGVSGLKAAPAGPKLWSTRMGGATPTRAISHV